MKIRRTWFFVLALLLVILWGAHLGSPPAAIPAGRPESSRIARLKTTPTPSHSLANYFRKPRKSSHAGAIRISAVEPTAPANETQKLEVAWAGRWWPAEITKTDGERHLIHYTGYGNEWNEWVTGDRMLFRGLERSDVAWNSLRGNLNTSLVRRLVASEQSSYAERIRQVSLEVTGVLPNTAQTRIWFEDGTSARQKLEQWVDVSTGTVDVTFDEPLGVGELLFKSIGSVGSVDLDMDLDLTTNLLVADGPDKDGDGLVDLVVSTGGESTPVQLRVFTNEGDGRFTESLPVDPPQPLVQGSPAKGDLLVEWGKQWWPAQILKTEDGKNLIHYLGYGSEWDEWVTSSRMGIYSGENQPAPESP